MLSRAEYLKEALDFIETMSILPNQVIWRYVLSGVVLQRDFVVAQFAFVKLEH